MGINNDGSCYTSAIFGKCVVCLCFNVVAAHFKQHSLSSLVSIKRTCVISSLCLLNAIQPNKF